MVLTVAPYLDTLLSRNDKYFEVIVSLEFFVCVDRINKLSVLSRLN